MLRTTFRIGGRDYSLSLDPKRADRNYEDENYAEWFIRDGERMIEMTAWKDGNGKFTDGLAELYQDMGAFEDGAVSERTNVIFSGKGNNPDVPAFLTIHYIVRDYQRMFKEHNSLEAEVRNLRGRLEKREREIDHLKRMLQSSQDKRKRLSDEFKAYIKRHKE